MVWKGERRREDGIYLLQCVVRRLWREGVTGGVDGGGRGYVLV